MRLEDRDRQVLAETFLSKVIRRDDLISFGYFSSIPRCNARLLALKQEGLLKTRTDLGGMELRAALYHCTSKSVRIAADVLDISPDEAIEVHRSGIRELAIKHSLRCNDLRARFIRELAGDSEIKLTSWSQELLCHHEFQVGERTTVIKPDALAELRGSEGQHHVFVEVDLGNAAIPKIKAKLHRFHTYADSGAFYEAYRADRFSVLLVTTDERRLAHIKRLALPQSLILSTWKRLAERGLQMPVFATPSSDHQLLSEVLQ